jgi:hypothetical protein
MERAELASGTDWKRGPRMAVQSGRLLQCESDPNDLARRVDGTWEIAGRNRMVSHTLLIALTEHLAAKITVELAHVKSRRRADLPRSYVSQASPAAEHLVP